MPEPTDAMPPAGPPSVDLVFDATPMGMAIVSAEGVYQRVNRAYAAMIGRLPEQMVGRSWRDFNTDRQVVADVSELGHVLDRHEGVVLHEKEYLHRDGSRVPAQLSLSMVRTPGAEPVLLVQAETLGAQQLAQRRLREVHSTYDGVVAVDPVGRVVGWDVGAERLFGVPAAEVTGRGIDQLLPRSEDPEHQRVIQALCRGEVPRLPGGTLEAQLRRADGTPLWIEMSLTGDTGLSHAHLVVRLRDVTDRRTAELCANLVRTAASTANSADNLADSAQQVLHDVCSRLGWVAGRAWTGGDAPASWYVREHRHPAGEVCPLEAHRALGSTDHLRRMARRGTAVLHTADLTRGDVRDALATCGVQRVVSVPVVAGGDVAGLFAFYVPRGAPAGEQVLQAIEQVGLLLGQVVERERSMQRLAFQAAHDPLTSLANRRRVLEEISVVQQRMADGSEQGRAAVLIVDVDRFKLVNDSLGYVAGDVVLQEVATRLRAVVPAEQLVGRLGSDEFVVLHRGEVLADGDAAPPGTALAEQLMAALTTSLDVAGQRVPLHVSIGVCPLGPDHAEAAHYPAAVLRDADAALRLAKRRGRSRVEVFDALLRSDTMTRMSDEAALGQAIAVDGLELHYQPIMSLGEGVPTGVEALVRWSRPGHGMVSPGEFIPLAEESGLIVELGRWVLRRACADAARWPTLLPELHRTSVSVNVSSRQLLHPRFLDHVDEALLESGLPATRLIVEITESVLIDDTQTVDGVLKSLRRRGIRLALDDFGTGYSSLGYVKALPVDILKIDKSFVDPITGVDEGTAFSEVVLKLAEATGLRTVAEGVESAHQAEALARLGCHSGQGFLWSRPLPEHELLHRIAQLRAHA
ncbi:sensor domain-containing protein [Angustibacter aerolatus]